MDIINWIVGHLVEILAAAGSVCLAASAITALTPTPKDDKIVGKVYKVVEFLGGVVGKAKDPGPEKSKVEVK
jgi:hypothetical protein